MNSLSNPNNLDSRIVSFGVAVYAPVSKFVYCIGKLSAQLKPKTLFLSFLTNMNQKNIDENQIAWYHQDSTPLTTPLDWFAPDPTPVSFSLTFPAAAIWQVRGSCQSI